MNFNGESTTLPGISGTTTEINITATDLHISDCVVGLCDGNTLGDTMTSGIYTTYNSSGQKYGGLLRDGTTKEWSLFKDATTEPNSSTDATALTTGILSVNKIQDGTSSVSLNGDSVLLNTSNGFISLQPTTTTIANSATVYEDFKLGNFSATQSTSASTGALQVVGGAGITKDVFVGGSVNTDSLKGTGSSLTVGANNSFASITCFNSGSMLLNTTSDDINLTSTSGQVHIYPSLQVDGDINTLQGLSTGNIVHIINGAESGSGLVGNTEAVINRAIALLPVGGTIHLGAGTYTINTTITLGALDYIIKGDGCTTILANSSGVIMMDQSNSQCLSFENLQISMNSGTSNGIELNNAGIVFRMVGCSCVIDLSQTNGSMIVNKITYTIGNAFIQDCTFDSSSNSTAGDFSKLNFFEGLLQISLSKFHFENCHFEGPTSVEHYAVAGGGGHSATMCLIDNCYFKNTFVDCRGQGVQKISDCYFEEAGVVSSYASATGTTLPNIDLDNCTFKTSTRTTALIRTPDASSAGQTITYIIHTNNCSWYHNASGSAFELYEPTDGTSTFTIQIRSINNHTEPTLKLETSGSGTLVQDTNNVLEYPLSTTTSYTSYTTNVALGALVQDSKYGLMKSTSTNPASPTWGQVQTEVLSDLTIGGDLIVTGSLVNTVSVEDPIIELAVANTGDTITTGILQEYDDGTQKWSGLLRKGGEDFYLFENASSKPTTATDPAGLTTAGLHTSTLTTAILNCDLCVATSGSDLTIRNNGGSGKIELNNDNSIQFTGQVLIPSKTPSSASDTGTTGEFCWDSSYIYICTSTNSWTRVAIASW